MIEEIIKKHFKEHNQEREILTDYKTIRSALQEMQIHLDRTESSISVKGEFLFRLESKKDWVNRVPRCLPDKIRFGEQWIWVDKNGNTFECGADFMEAEKHDTYPCKVYRLITVAVAWKEK